MIFLALPEMKKEEIINTLLPIGYYWLGESNPHATLTICKWLETMSMSPKTKGKLTALRKNWNVTFEGRSESEFQIPMPDVLKFYDEEKRLMWITTNIIMNMIAVGAFEMAFMNLCDIANIWNDFYLVMLDMIRKSKEKTAFCEWLMMHTMTAFDIVGEKDMTFLGYEIKKIEN